MELKKAIQQKEFRSEQEKGIVNLIFTYNWLKGHLVKHLKPFGITMQQFNVLRILNGQYPKPISTSSIRNRMLDKMSDASRIVERLHKKGLAERQRNTLDKRLVDVMITEKGQQLVEEIGAKSKQLDNILKKLNKADLQQLNRLLDIIRS